MNRRVLLVGECVLDVIQEVETYPKEDDDLKSTFSRFQRGGNASNSSTVLSLLGNSCELLTTFSDAKIFKFIIEDLRQSGVSYKNSHYYSNCEMPLSTVLLCKDTGSRTIIHSNKNLPHANFEDFDKCDLNEYRWVHFEARNFDETSKMMLKVIEHNKTQRGAHEQIKMSLDVEKKRDENLLLIKFVDFAFLGKDYAEFLGCKDMTSGINKIKELVTKEESYKNPELTIICAWGELGAQAIDKTGKIFTSKVYTPEIIKDTLGAGDCFLAGTLHKLIENANDIESSIDFGCRVAGHKIGDYGYDHIKNEFTTALFQ